MKNTIHNHTNNHTQRTTEDLGNGYQRTTQTHPILSDESTRFFRIVVEED